MKLPYKIKKRQANIAIYTVLGVFMFILSLVCLFTPFISYFSNAFDETTKIVYMGIGGVCTPFFAFFTCYNLLNIISPPTGLIIKKSGFHEKTMADGGIGFVPVEAIISLKVFGNKNKQYLGIRLDSDYLPQIGDSAKAKREMKSNIESGMPAIIIRESDIDITVNDLLKIMLEIYGSDESEAVEIKKDNDMIYGIPDSDLELSGANIVANLPPLDDVITIDNNADSEPIDILPTESYTDDIPLGNISEEKVKITSIDELLSRLNLNLEDNTKKNG